MTEITRLLESSNPVARSLLEAGLDDEPPAGAFERAVAALGAAGATAAVAAGAAHAGSATGVVAGAKPGAAALVAKWLLIGATGGVVASGAAVQLAAPRATAPAEAVAPPAPPRSRPPVSERAAEALPERADVAPAAELPPELPARAAAASPSVRAAPELTAPPGPASTALPDAPNPLRGEVALIDGARRALVASDAAGCLAALDRYGSERRTGVLDKEARVLRIEALWLAGQKQRAAALAAAYLEEFPGDPHGARLRALVPAKARGSNGAPLDM